MRRHHQNKKTRTLRTNPIKSAIPLSNHKKKNQKPTRPPEKPNTGSHYRENPQTELNYLDLSTAENWKLLHRHPLRTVAFRPESSLLVISFSECLTRYNGVSWRPRSPYGPPLRARLLTGPLPPFTNSFRPKWVCKFKRDRIVSLDCL